MHNFNGDIRLEKKVNFINSHNNICFKKDSEEFLFNVNDTTILTIGNGGITSQGNLIIENLTVDTIDVGTTATIQNLTVTENLTVGNIITNDLFIQDELSANSLAITTDAIIYGSLNVIGGISTSSAVDLTTTSPLLVLALGNQNDFFDIGFYGQYNDGTTRYTGLFRDTSDASKSFIFFDGITNIPTATITIDKNEDYANVILGNLTLNGTDLYSNNITTGILGVTNYATISSLQSTEIGVTTLGVTGSAIIKILSSTLIQSVDIGTTFLGVSGNAEITGNLDIIGAGSMDSLSVDTINVTDTITSDIINVGSLSVTGISTFSNNVTINGDLTVDLGTLVVDSSNERVGINITNPSYELDVSGDINYTGNIRLNGTIISFGQWGTNGTDIYSQNTGQVGIGTINPIYDLDVSGDINSEGVYRINGIEVLSNNSLNIGITQSSLETVGTLTSLNVVGDLTVDTNTLYIDSSNNEVGIGTINPGYKLDVSGDINTEGVYRVNGTEVLSSTTLGSGIVNSSLTSVGSLTSLVVSGDLTVDTNTLYVDSASNFVGIGTTNPQYDLDVSGNVNVGGEITVDGLQIGGVTATVIWQTESNDIYNLNSGDVGIGTTAPVFKLDVSGDINSRTGIYIEGIDIETVFNIIQVENQKVYFNEFLTLDNSNNINNDYSLGVTEFSYTNESVTDTLFVSNLVIMIKDDGTFNLDNYASIGTTLINGMNIYYTGSTGTVKNYIVGTTYPIQKNADWNNYTNDIKLTDLGTGDSIYTITLDFRNNGSYVILRENDRLAIEVNDDLSSINEHKIQLNGFLYNLN